MLGSVLGIEHCVTPPAPGLRAQWDEEKQGSSPCAWALWEDPALVQALGDAATLAHLLLTSQEHYRT